jgi:hypothetical protein
MSMTTDQERLMQRLGSLHDRIHQLTDLEARAALVEGWARRDGLMPEKERLINEGERVLDQLLSVMTYTVEADFLGEERRFLKAGTVEEALSLGEDMLGQGASSVVIIDPDRQPWSLANLREVREEAAYL